MAILVVERCDYDRVAIVWGPGQKTANLQACGQACHDHVPAPLLAGATPDSSRVGLGFKVEERADQIRSGGVSGLGHKAATAQPVVRPALTRRQPLSLQMLPLSCEG